MRINYKLFNPGKRTVLPVYQTHHSAGMDLTSSSEEPLCLEPGEFKLIPTNLILEIPEGFEGQVRPRSGLALKHGITVLNSPGTIDSDYRGEVKVLLINLGKVDFVINYGDRIAQLIISKYYKAELCLKKELSGTDRGEGGYGSTGK